MEYWDNSYTSWGWYNEVLEHRNDSPLFEADEDQQPKDGGTEQEPETAGDGSSTGAQDGDSNNKTTEEKQAKEDESTAQSDIDIPVSDTVPMKFLGKDYDTEIGNEAGEYLVKLRDLYSDRRFSSYNPWKMTWRSHPDNIAMQLKYLFPNSDGTYKIWNPEYKGMSSYDAKDVKTFGQSDTFASFGGFKGEDKTKFGNRGDTYRCSGGILLESPEGLETKIFDVDRDKLEKIAEEGGFLNPINIDILELARCKKGDREKYIKKIEKNHKYKSMGRFKDIADNAVYPKIFIHTLSDSERDDFKNEFGDLNTLFDGQPDSKSKRIKVAVEKYLKPFHSKSNEKIIHKPIELKKDNESGEVSKVRGTINNILLNKDMLEVSPSIKDKEGTKIATGMFDIPTVIIKSLYYITHLVISSNDTVSVTYEEKPNTSYRRINSYKNDGDSIENDDENALIILESGNSGDSNVYGMEMSIGLCTAIFSSGKKSEIEDKLTESRQDDCVSSVKPNYLSPLVGLDLSGIRREIMESAGLNGLLEATLSDYLPKRGRKAPKYIKHPYKGTNGSITYKGIKQKENGAARTMWLVPSDSDPSKTYTVQIDVEVPGKGGLFSIARKKNRKPGELVADRSNLRTSNLRVFCSCPDFHWGGAEYNLNKKDAVIKKPDLNDGDPGNRFNHTTKDGKSYVSTFPTTVKPEKRDPEGVKDGCKHIYAVLLEFRRKIPTIFADAKKAPADLEMVGSFNENTGILVQTPEAQGIVNELADIALPDNSEQTQTEPIEQTEQADQTENRGENVELVAESEPEEYSTESEPEQSSEEDLVEETVPEEDNGVEKNKGLFARIKDGLSSLKDKAGNALGRIFRHEDCELAGQLIERVLESDDPHVIQDSVNKIAALLEANGKHEYAKSLLESVYTDSKKSMK